MELMCDVTRRELVDKSYTHAMVPLGGFHIMYAIHFILPSHESHQQYPTAHDIGAKIEVASVLNNLWTEICI